MAQPCLTIDQLEKLVREGTLGGSAGGDEGDEGADVEEHLRDCSGCRTRLAEMREADAFIAGIAQRMPSGPSGPSGPRGSRDSRGARSARGTPASRHDDSRPPTMRDDFPGYAVEAIVDIGGQGAIYKARQIATGRLVAIKVPLGDTVRQGSRRYRFRREIELTSRLDHPGIVGVFGVCEAPDGRIGCVMEFVEGQRFDEWATARRGPGKDGGRAGVRHIVAAAAKVAEAIAYAHQRGVLHRDLKPSNVLVTGQGFPRVLDFGLAKALDGGSGSFVTMTGAFLGTLAYAAPEQVDGRSDETDIRTDVHGIGLVLYQALAGRVPWDVEAAPPELCSQIRRGDAPRPTPLGGTPDAELDAIVLKAIATDMDRRYPSAALLAEDLDRWLTGRPVRARFDSRWYVVRKTAWRRRWWIAAAMVVLCLVGTLATLGVKARVAEAMNSARELESHWSSIADARATARDDFTFGEQKVWEVFLNATEALERGGIEGTGALGHRFIARSHGSSGDSSSPTDWSMHVPTSPAYWALAEIYLRTPVAASLPELLPHFAAIDSITDQILIGRGRALERWDWRTGQVVGRIDLPLPEGARVESVVASKGWASVISSPAVVTLVDLERNIAISLPTPTGFTGALLSGPNVACVDASDRRRVELWSVHGESPRLLWSRDLEFRFASMAIDNGGRFLAACSPAGDLAAFDLTSGVELLRRRPEEVRAFYRVASRGRPGEILAWGGRQLAALEWTEAGLSLSTSPDLPVVNGEGVQQFGSGSRGRRCLARLDRDGIAIGHVDQPIEQWRTIPSLRSASLPGLFSNVRHVLVRLAQGERHTIVDLDSTGVTQLAQPTVPRIGATPTTFSVGFVEGSGALLTATMDGMLRRYDVSSSAEAVNDNKRPDAPTSSPAITASPASAECTSAQVSSHGLTCLAVDGDWTYVGTHERGGVDAKLFRVRNGAAELILDDRRSWYCGIVVAPGRALWALGGDGRIFRMNLGTGAVEAERPLAPKRAFRALARMARRGLVLAGSRHPALHLLDETTLDPVCEPVPMAPVCEIVASPTDPDLFVTTHDAGVIRVWRMTGGSTPDEPPQVTLVREMGAHASPVFCAAFHPSGRILATGGGASETRDIRLWDIEFGRELVAFSLFELGVFSIAFSPDGRWLAAGGEPVPDRFAEGGQCFLIDLTAAERAMAGNLEYHIARLKRANGGEPPPQAEVLRRRFGVERAGGVAAGGG